MRYSRCVNCWNPESLHAGTPSPARSGPAKTASRQQGRAVRLVPDPGLILMLILVAGVCCHGSPGSAGGDPPAPMYATASQTAGPLNPIRKERGKRQKQDNPACPIQMWDYGSISIPQEPDLYLLAVLFPETGDTPANRLADPYCRWTLTLTGAPGVTVSGTLSTLVGMGLAADVSALRNQSVAVTLEAAFRPELADPSSVEGHFEPVLSLIRLTPATEALPGACLGLACFRLTGSSDYTVLVPCPPDPARSVGCTAGETWLIQPFCRLAAIPRPATGEGGSLINRWIAQVDNPDAFAFLFGNSGREP